VWYTGGTFWLVSLAYELEGVAAMYLLLRVLSVLCLVICGVLAIGSAIAALSGISSLGLLGGLLLALFYLVIGTGGYYLLSKWAAIMRSPRV
jgi:hypothetical protein